MSGMFWQSRKPQPFIGLLGSHQMIIGILEQPVLMSAEAQAVVELATGFNWYKLPHGSWSLINEPKAIA